MRQSVFFIFAALAVSLSFGDPWNSGQFPSWSPTKQENLVDVPFTIEYPKSPVRRPKLYCTPIAPGQTTAGNSGNSRPGWTQKPNNDHLIKPGSGFHRPTHQQNTGNSGNSRPGWTQKPNNDHLIKPGSGFHRPTHQRPLANQHLVKPVINAWPKPTTTQWS